MILQTMQRFSTEGVILTSDGKRESEQKQHKSHVQSGEKNILSNSKH